MALGQNILNLRKKKGLSQEALGELVNVTRQTISNWELEETTPNPEQLKALSSVFNISIDKLLDNGYFEDNGVVYEKFPSKKFKIRIFRILSIIWIIASITNFLEGNHISGYICICTSIISLIVSFIISKKMRN